MKIRIVKVGGSLLLRPDLIGDFHAWYRQSTKEPCCTLVIVGGGEMINAVRGWDALRPGDPASVHWRCVEMLRFSFESICESMRDVFEKGSIVEPFEAIATGPQWQEFVGQSLPVWLQDNVPRKKLILVNVPAFYTPALSHASASGLPEDWQTTTDAIALWLAHQVSVDLGGQGVSRSKMGHKPRGNSIFPVECTLLKSCTPPTDWTLDSLVEAGIIDPACRIFADSPVELNVEKLPA